MRPNRPVYLDNQATTPLDPRVLEAMLPWFTERFGNPHSVEHRMGQEAETAVETARAEVAALIGAEPREVVLTSGATESNNIAIKGAARHAARTGSDRRRIITVATEHKCVLEAVSDLRDEGFEPVILPVGPDGLLEPGRLADALRVPSLLVSVMAVNNETGVIQDLPALSALTRDAGALFHTDAAQAGATIELDVGGIDLLSLSGHKIYGPKGIGALYVRRRPRARLQPLFSGGGQERGLRAGTLPTPLVVGFGLACRLAMAERQADQDRIASLRQRLLDGLDMPVSLNGSREHRIAGNLNLVFPVPALDLLARMPDLCMSTGSACSSAAVEPSYVLRALGLDDLSAQRTLRIGLGRFTSRADVDFGARALNEAARALTIAGADA